MFCAAVIRAVHKYGGLLRASVASATNDHRLGANEAPPAIISIFLGDQLDRRVRPDRQGRRDQLEGEGHAHHRRRHPARCCPPIRATATAPARSPSPATASSSGRRARCSRSPGRWSMINTILAEALDYIATEIESLVAGGTEFNAAVQKVLEEIITDHGASCSTATATPTTGRSRPRPAACPTCAPPSTPCPQLITDEAIELFSHYGVFSHREMHSRYEIALEQYALSIGVEARTTLEMANTVILPAALRYQTELATNARQPDRRSARARHVDARRGVGVDRRPAGRHRRAARRARPRAAARSRTRRRTPGPSLLPAMDAVRAAADDARDPGGRRPLAARRPTRRCSSSSRWRRGTGSPLVRR